ncbi:MAG: hypothetical protein E3J88_03550 [Anaerolineales bacterium]|nr:MAG: hypothetical protein E3J88_03550 [Anaerolineales bacterium]
MPTSMITTAFHPVKVDLLGVDSRRAREALSWEPTKSFEELAWKMVETDLNDLGGEIKNENLCHSLAFRGKIIGREEN